MLHNTNAHMVAPERENDNKNMESTALQSIFSVTLNIQLGHTENSETFKLKKKITLTLNH